MRFTEPEIRALLEAAKYSNKAAPDHLVRIHAARQQKIGREYISAVLPLEDLRIENGRLEFDDLGVRYGFPPASTASPGRASTTNRKPRSDCDRVSPAPWRDLHSGGVDRLF